MYSYCQKNAMTQVKIFPMRYTYNFGDFNTNIEEVKSSHAKQFLTMLHVYKTETTHTDMWRPLNNFLIALMPYQYQCILNVFMLDLKSKKNLYAWNFLKSPT